MSISVAVAGASGYAGGEVLRLLAGHPDVTIGALTAHSNAGERLGALQPHLYSLADRMLMATTAENLAGHDVVVLALPHGASAQISAELPDDVLVIDLGADHRLVNAQEWVDFYGSPHAGTWPYGMPELLVADADAKPADTPRKQREHLVGARRIAVPGCNVTAVTLGLQPGLASGLISPHDIVAVLANGYSGAGKSLKTHLLASEALGSAQAYAVGGSHRHIPEVIQNLQAGGAKDVTLSFTPTLVPMSRGILATATARLVNPETTIGELRSAWEAAYADEPFVHLLPLDASGAPQWPTTAMTLGANTALTQIALDARAGRVVTVTAIDNLVKGTAGAAVQSMNIALGLSETAGLTTNGVAP